MKIFLGLAALAGGLYLFMGRAFAATGKLGMPVGAEPDAPDLRALNPVKIDAVAPSQRMYEVWMYPLQPNVGVYTVAKEKFGKAWISFFYLADKNLRIPVKTNATEIGLTVPEAANKVAQLRTDWNMPS